MSIRDIALFLLIFGAIPFMIRRPVVGIYFWTFIGLANPHRYTWGFAFDFPFALLCAICTFIGLFVTKDERQWKGSPEIYVIIIFMMWMSVTTVFALEPDTAWAMWSRTMKILLMSLVALVVMYKKEHVERMVWVLVLSLGFYGVKGGIYTIVTGASGRIYGPPFSFIEA